MQPTVETNDSLGIYLKKAREGKAVSIEQVAYATRISLKMLRALEEDDHTALPAPTFVRGYLQAYAKYVRIDTQDLLLRYQHHLATEPDSKRGNIRSHYLYVRERYQEKRRLVLVIVLFAMMLSVAGAYFLLKAQREKHQRLAKTAEQIQKSEEAKPAIPPTPADPEKAAAAKDSGNPGELAKANDPQAKPAEQPKPAEKTALNPGANPAEAAKLEAAKQEAAKQEAAKQEAAKKEAEKQAKLEAEKQAKLEAAKQEAEKKEAAKQAKLEAAKQEAAKKEAEKQAKLEAAKQEAEKKEAAKQAKLETAKQEAAKKEAEKQAKLEAAKLAAANPAPAAQAEAKNHTAQLHATTDVWFRYQTDEDEVKDLTLRTGKTMILRANKAIKIFSGNLGAIKATLDGKEVPLLTSGKSNKSVVIPESEAGNYKLPLFPQFQPKQAVNPEGGAANAEKTKRPPPPASENSPSPGDDQ